MKKKIFILAYLPLLLMSLSQINAQWVQTNGPYGGTILSFTFSDTKIFAGTWGAGIYISTNNGINWSEVNSGLTNSVVHVLTAVGTNIFAGTDDGVYLSTNSGGSWSNTGLAGIPVYSLASNNRGLFAGTEGGVYVTINNGASWNSINYGLITTSGIYALAISANYIFAGTGDGIFISTDDGANWNQPISGLNNISVYALAVKGTSLFAGTYNGVFYSTDNGSSWNQRSSGLTNANIYALAVSGTNIFAGTYGGIFLSTNNGVNWNEINTGLTNIDIYALAVSGTNIFAGTYGGIFLSTNNGVNWNEKSSGIINTNINAMVVNSAGLFAGTIGSGIFLSTNNGTDWNGVSSGLTDFYVFSLAVSGQNIYAGTNDGVYLSTNNGNNWVAKNSGLTYYNVNSLTINGNQIYAGTMGGIYLSTNNGGNWTDLGLSRSVRSIAVANNKIFAGTKIGVLLTTNNGSSWTNVSTGLTDSSVFVLAASGTKLFAGTYDGMFESTNNGTNWSKVNGGLSGYYVYCVFVDGTNIYTGTENGVFLSTDNGVNWSEINTGLAKTNVISLAKIGDYLFAGTPENGVWKKPLSTTAVSWISVTSPNGGENWMIGDSKNITWADSGVSNVKIDYTTDNGMNWSTIISSTPASTGSYSWSVANTPSINCKVKVSNINNLLVNDVSDAVFSILQKSVASLNVTKPAGGEELIGSLPFTITWNSSNVSKVDIELSVNNGTDWSIIDSNISSDAKQYSWTVPTDKSSNTCKIKITDKSNPSVSALSSGSFSIVNYTSSIDISTRTFTFGDPTKSVGYRLISVPGKSNSLRIDQFVLGEVKKDWTAFYDNGNSTDYFVEFDGSSLFNFGPGKGFWVLSTRSISLNGKVSAVNLDNNGSYSFQIHPGWNIISNPYDTPVSSSSVQNANGLNENLYSWNGSKYDISSLMNPYEGYYIYNSANLTSLKIPYKPVASLQKRIALSEFSKVDAHTLSISTVSKEVNTSVISLGIDQNASDNYDKYDCLAPPGDFEQASLRIINRALGLQWKEMYTEYRKEIGDGQKYEFRIRNKSGRDIELSIEGAENFKDYEVYLIDKRLNGFQNIRENKLFSMPYNVKECTYEIIIGKDNFIVKEKSKLNPVRFSLEQNYPNPFNPITRIRYSTPVNAIVSLQVYDITGRKIKELVKSYKEAGNYEVPFDANEKCSGIYLYRIEIRNNGNIIFSDNKKMSIIK